MSRTLCRRWGESLIVLALVAGGAAGTARADLAYGYAQTEVSNFGIFGANVLSIGNDPAEPFAHSENNAESDPPPESDVKTGAFIGFYDWSEPQAKTGSGPFPGEDEFGAGLTGEGARADNSIQRAVPIGGFEGTLAAEARRTSVGSARGRSLIDTRIFIEQLGPGPMTFSFTAMTHLLAQKTPGYNIASAQSEFVLELRDYTTDVVLLTWAPGKEIDPITNVGGAVSDVSQPYNLNKLLIAEGDNVSAGFAGGGNFALSFAGLFGQQFTLSVFAKETAIAEVFPPPAPEPAAWVLMSGGVAGLAIVARRRQRARLPR